MGSLPARAWTGFRWAWEPLQHDIPQGTKGTRAGVLRTNSETANGPIQDPLAAVEGPRGPRTIRISGGARRGQDHQCPKGLGLGSFLHKYLEFDRVRSHSTPHQLSQRKIGSIRLYHYICPLPLIFSRPARSTLSPYTHPNRVAPQPPHNLLVLFIHIKPLGHWNRFHPTSSVRPVCISQRSCNRVDGHLPRKFLGFDLRTSLDFLGPVSLIPLGSMPPILHRPS